MTSPYPHPAALAPEALLQQCEVTRTRRSGPGGQHRNKVETAVVLRHLPSGLRAEANERRSQAENLAAAVFRLRVNLALDLRTPPPADEDAAEAMLPNVAAATEPPPSLLWRSRSRGGRLNVSPLHADFPALLAEALDDVERRQGDVRAAAARLGVTPSQLVRFLQCEPRALHRVNEVRKQRGLRPLR